MRRARRFLAAKLVTPRLVTPKVVTPIGALLLGATIGMVAGASSPNAQGASISAIAIVATPRPAPDIKPLPAKRRAMRLGLDGEIALASPSARGLVVSGRDTIAALPSDHALADAATLPRQPVRNLQPRQSGIGLAPRVAALSATDEIVTAELAGLKRPEFDLDLAKHVRGAFPEGLDRLAAKNGERERECLAQAIYFEARGEPLEGRVAVAEVVLNRVDSEFWPDTVCGVVNQGAGGKRGGCQFSYVCDGRPEKISSKSSWEDAMRLATAMMQGAPRRLTGHATHYHATYVSPRWARTMERTAQLGEHIFYRRLLRFSKKAAN